MNSKNYLYIKLFFLDINSTVLLYCHIGKADIIWWENLKEIWKQIPFINGDRVEESISNDPAKDKVEQNHLRGEIETNVVSIHKHGDQEIQLADVKITYPRKCDLCKLRAKTLKVFTSHMFRAHKTS